MSRKTPKPRKSLEERIKTAEIRINLMKLRDQVAKEREKLKSK